MTQFRYQPLDSSRFEIRLLYPIQHADFDGSLSAPNPELDPFLLTKDNFFITPDLSMEFELRTVSLDNDSEPVYTALSYVWGDPATSKSITVNECTFAITENLNIALRHLQYDSIAPAIWIDAICINQNDDDEKNNQIPLMYRIYSSARDVLMWLGPGTSEDYYAVMVLYQAQRWYLENIDSILSSLIDAELEDLRVSRAQAASRSRATSKSQYICDHTFGDIPVSANGSRNNYMCKSLEIMADAISTVNTEAPASVKVISHIDHIAAWWMASLLVSQWWNRIWVIQEYTSARSRHFQLGSCRLSDTVLWYSRIFTGCLELRVNRGDDNLVRSSIASDIPTHLINWGKKDDRDRKFFKVLRELYVFNKRNLYCKDAKDRIFALISLAKKDCESLGIQVDYRKTIREVYIDVARSLLRAKELDVLSLCYRRNLAYLEDSADSSASDESRLDLPSWVPDWSVKIVRPHGLFAHQGERSSYWMTIEECPDLERSQDKVNQRPNSIVLTGELLDEITQVCSLCDGDEHVEHDGNSELDMEPPLTPYEMLASVSADIEAWSNSARHNHKSDVFAPYPRREHSRTILGLVRDEILDTIIDFLYLKQLRPLRHLRRCRNFVLRHFQELRDFLILGYRHDEERVMHEAVWRVPVWNLEYTTKGHLQKATKSSEARYQTSLHLGLSHRYGRNAIRLDGEVSKHGLLKSVRDRILFFVEAVKSRFHTAMAVMYCKSPAHRLARACCILPSVFWAIIPVRTPSRWVDEAMQFASLYLIAMRQGPPDRVVQTKRGYVGVASARSRPGDKIYVFSGSRVAHVLRERDNGQDGYTLVGDAFVYNKIVAGYPLNIFQGENIELF